MIFDHAKDQWPISIIIEKEEGELIELRVANMINHCIEMKALEESSWGTRVAKLGNQIVKVRKTGKTNVGDLSFHAWGPKES